MQQSRKGGGNHLPASAAVPPAAAAHLFFFFILVLLLGGSVSFRWINTPTIGGWGGDHEPSITARTEPKLRLPRWPPLACPTSTGTAALSCPAPPPSLSLPREATSTRQLCPDYFRWIHEDFRPWAGTGITREMVEQAREMASFRLVVIGGRAYVEKYGRRTFQTRDVFTQWGIAQLLRRYPGRVPDLELMFNCVDHPAVMKASYPGGGNATATAPPPVFGYCSDDSTLDIAFPDWSFWGWSEVNIKPWEVLLGDLKEGNRRTRWADREPYAYWKGNPWVAAGRKDLLRCNVSATQDWNARLYAQDWGREEKRGFQDSNLASQCKHRFKIYIEGNTWSVSEKYIMACDSPTLLVKPRYYDFFSRALVPLRHYWPVRDDDKCRSIKFAVHWGNHNQLKAQEIGQEGSGFIQEQVKMDYVYDYMFHLLKEYAKLLRFKPTKPPGAMELCPEMLACPAKGLQREFMVQSMEKSPRETGPCTLPPPLDPLEMRMLMAERANSTGRVELWETEAWESQKTREHQDSQM